MNTLLTVAVYGTASFLLTRWFAELRHQSTIARRARAQLGLETDDDTRPDERQPLAPRTKVTVAISLLVAVVGVRFIGVTGILAATVPLLINRSLQQRAAHKRKKALDAALAPALQRIIDQLSVGRTMIAAIESTVHSADEPLSSILRRIVNEHQLGIQLDDSLSIIAAQENHHHLGVLSSALALHARHGGSLTHILTNVLEAIEEEDRLERDLLTLTADARLSANVLLAMPVGALVITSLLSPGYATPLIATSLGRGLSLGAVLIGCVGVMWLRRLARPEEMS